MKSPFSPEISDSCGKSKYTGNNKNRLFLLQVDTSESLFQNNVIK